MELLTKNEINWIQFLNRLKTTKRTGWEQIGIPADEIESVYSHVASTKDLVVLFNEKYNLNLNIEKINKLLTVKELFKAFPDGEPSIIKQEDNRNSKLSPRDKTILIIKKFGLSDEILTLFDEAISLETIEAKYANMFSKFESDLQAVDYYEKGLMKMEPVLEDIKWFDEETRNQILDLFEQYPIPCLSWLTFDSRYYKENELFTNLSNELINYCINKYKLENTDRKKI